MSKWELAHPIVEQSRNSPIVLNDAAVSQPCFAARDRALRPSEDSLRLLPRSTLEYICLAWLPWPEKYVPSE